MDKQIISTSVELYLCVLCHFMITVIGLQYLCIDLITVDEMNGPEI